MNMLLRRFAAGALALSALLPAAARAETRDLSLMDYFFVPAYGADFMSFVPGRADATFPLGATDYFPLIPNGGSTKKVAGNLMATRAGAETLLNKTLTNPTINAATLSGTIAAGSATFNSPTLVTPALGTPSALVGTNATGFPIGTAISGLGTNVATALGNTLNGASGPVGGLTPTNSNCVVGNGTAWTSTTCPSSGSLSVATTGGSTVTGVTSITFPATMVTSGTTPNAVVSPFTPVDDCQSGTCGTSGSAAISVDDAGSLILLGAHTYTIAQAGTGGFDAGWLPAGVMCISGPCVLTSTTSTFSPASGSTTLTMQTGEIAFLRSNGSIYRTTIAANGSTVVYPSNANTFTGAQTFGETHGTTYAPTLTSNNYTATSSDCGKTLLMPTGTTPTLTLPNLNASCTIVAVQNSAVQFTPTAASGGSVVSVNSYTKSKAQNAILFLTIITPSSSAAKWALAGDGA